MITTRIIPLLLGLLGIALAPGVAAALQATVTWTDNSTNETGFRIERRDGADAAPWTSQGTVAANVSTFNQAGLAAGTRYCYRVVAIGTLGDATPSPEGVWDTGRAAPGGGVQIIFAP